MIYGKLDEIKNYIGINSNLDIAINYILNNDINSLPLGITNIKGQDILINIMEIETRTSDNANFEVHKNHFDIFIPIIGKEKVEIGNSNYENPSDYNEESDIFFVNTNSVSTCILDESNFIIAHFGEPHKPSLAVDKPEFLKKAVLKILK